MFTYYVVQPSLIKKLISLWSKLGSVHSFDLIRIRFCNKGILHSSSFGVLKYWMLVLTMLGVSLQTSTLESLAIFDKFFLKTVLSSTKHKFDNSLTACLWELLVTSENFTKREESMICWWGIPIISSIKYLWVFNGKL